VVICLERDADLHTAQLMQLLLAVSCFSKIQIGFTFLVPAHPGSPGQGAVKRVCVCVCVCVCLTAIAVVMAPAAIRTNPDVLSSVRASRILRTTFNRYRPRPVRCLGYNI